VLDALGVLGEAFIGAEVERSGRGRQSVRELDRQPLMAPFRPGEEMGRGNGSRGDERCSDAFSLFHGGRGCKLRRR
jgi:hypothetical protein